MTDKSWEKVPIGEILNGFFDGPHATPKPSNEGPIFLGIKNISEDGLLNLENIRHISEEEFPKWIRRVEPKPNDIVFTYEATLNRYAIIPEGFRGCLGRRLALIRPNPNKAYYKYLFYYFFGKEWRDTIANNMILGSTVDRIPLIDFQNFEITLPPILIQHKIASILSAFDDLIENNTRRIQILEEMAQRIYREWFLYFRFPGHENIKMVDSELGMIPKGWEILKVTDRFKTVLGGTPSRRKPEYWEAGTIPWINSSEVNGLRILNPTEYITEEGYNKSSTKLMPSRTTVIAITGATLGQVSMIEKEMCANQSVVGIYDENYIYNEYLYLTFSNIIGEVINRASGGAQQHINKEIVNRTKITVPLLEQMDTFNTIIQPIFDQIKNLLTTNLNLRQTRDLLLPKLISGKIDVSDLDIDIGATDV